MCAVCVSCWLSFSSSVYVNNIKSNLLITGHHYFSMLAVVLHVKCYSLHFNSYTAADVMCVYFWMLTVMVTINAMYIL